MRPALLPLTLLALAACQIQPQTQAPTDPMVPSCGAEQLQHLLGTNVADFSAPDARGGARVIGPDMAVTMDYRPDRLNVEHDRDGIIRRIYCS